MTRPIGFYKDEEGRTRPITRRKGAVVVKPPKRSKIYVQILGMVGGVDTKQDAIAHAKIKRYYGQVYPIDKMPKGFDFGGAPAMTGGAPFLFYVDDDGNRYTLSRIYWAKKNGKWVNLTLHDEYSTPKKEFQQHLADEAEKVSDVMAWNPKLHEESVKIHIGRSRKAQIIDEALKAKTPKYWDDWVLHPERFDLKGVDTPKDKPKEVIK
jgi:hypothetical protein